MAHKFEVDSVHGTQSVVSVDCHRHSHSGRVDNVYTCRCLKCGAIGQITEGGLIMASRGKGKRCKMCPKSVNTNAHNDCGDHCPGCYDLPHRRPQSKPCKCGKRYEPDTFTATVEDAHACADLWQYASRELGPDSFAGIVDWL